MSVSIAGLAGCGDDSSGGSSGGSSSPSVVTPSTSPSGTTTSGHASLPQIINLGGPVLSHPRFLAITYTSDSLEASLEQFTARFAASTEWSEMVSEYGVGPAIADSPVRVSTAAPTTIDDTQIQSWLISELDSASRPLGAPDGQTIYMIYFPSTTTITASGQKSCTDFDGYHSSLNDPSTGLSIAYAVIAHCADQTVNDVTATASHELVESATDPDIYNSAWNAVASSEAVWSTVSYGTEAGDLCQDYDTSYYTPSDIGYEIQRSWSNAAAQAGNNPCGPTSAADAYYNAAPVLPDTVSYNDPNSNPQAVTTQGVEIPVGQSKTIELDLFSNAATTGAWQLSAAEDGTTKHLAFTFSKTSGINGDRVFLTIKVNSQNTTYNAEPFWILSTLNGVTYYWPVVVGN